MERSVGVRRDGVPPGYRTQSSDTEIWAERLVFERYQSMTPRQKASMLTDICRSANQLSLAGLRSRYPELDERALALKAAALRVGRQVVFEITGIDPDTLGENGL